MLKQTKYWALEHNIMGIKFWPLSSLCPFIDYICIHFKVLAEILKVWIH